MSGYFVYGDLAAKYRNSVKDMTSDNVGSYWIPSVSGRIDMALSQRYSVPFSPVPWAIRDLAVDLCYWAMTYREENQDKLKADIDARILALQNGTAALIDPTTNLPIVAQPQVSLTTSGTNTSFGMDRPENWDVDPNWQQDFRNSRGQCW